MACRDRESRPTSPQDTTGFSRVVFQLQPTTRRRDSGHHRLQPCGVSVSTYEPSLTDGALEAGSLDAG
jgi:hypothetical protein